MSDTQEKTAETAAMGANSIPKEGNMLELSEQIRYLKQQKANAKSAFTKAKNRLYTLIECEDQPSRKSLRDGIDEVNAVQVEAIGVMVELARAYSKEKLSNNVAKIDQEISYLEDENAAVVEHAQEYLHSRSDASSVSNYQGSRVTPKQPVFKTRSLQSNKVVEDQLNIPEQTTDHYMPRSTSKAIGNDMWKQLKRVSIPVFSGNVRTYESWKSAFLTCIDQAPVTAEYKLLQLRQYLSGEALKVVERLGHSAVAYDIALERLERKYGGKRRQVALQLEELTSLKPIRPGHARDVERFADVLDVAVVNLREADRVEELGNGLLYAMLQKKMTESMIAQYQRWLFERERQESVENLREWVTMEAQFQTVAAEAVHGVCEKGKQLDYKRKESCTFVSSEQQPSSKANGKKTICRVCTGQHQLWKCELFKGMNSTDRWNTVKKLQYCFRCLGSYHRGVNCRLMKQCGINGCVKNHNRLLHEETRSSDLAHDQSRHHMDDSTSQKCAEKGLVVNVEKDTLSDTKCNGQDLNERAHATMPLSELTRPLIALRTVPVVLKNGNKRIRVNALLDDASTRTYINADVAAELGLQGKLQKVSVNVLNGQTETFETKPVEFRLESVDGTVDIEMSALTTNRVTGDLKVIDWQTCKKRWSHLQSIRFPSIGRRPIVDILIGVDYLQLHQSYEDVSGDVAESGPIARKTPLGWTCIGKVDEHETCQQSHFIRTYFTTSKDNELNSLVQRFWEVEEIKGNPKMNKPDEKEALQKVNETLVLENDRYQVGIPWKDDVQSLPNDYQLAFHRLVSTEKKLSKDQNLALAYDKIISQYVEKGYIRKVSHEESTDHIWYLPHFPVLRPEKTTTKVRIVFDASAKFNETSLNDVINPGPKLHNELFDVLLRFRKHPVALVCDISEMFLQIQLAPEDRPYHRFLWRSMKTNEPPKVYEFSRLVFGVTSSPFLAQYVTQEHAKAHQVDLPLAAETVIESTYMDDSMDSVENDEKGVELYRQLTELWSSASMHAKKWLSNSLAILENIPVEDRASEVDLSKDYIPSVKTLGLMWIAQNDVFTFKVETPLSETVTKRSFLRQIAKLFDPLGLIGPFIITAKIMLQKMWASGYEWDDELTEDLRENVVQWLGQWPDMKHVEVPRCLRLQKEVYSTTLHAFVDASMDAYGTVVYSVHTYLDGEKSIRIVAAKSRVAPLKACSIPRLELMAAVLGLRLISEIVKALKMEMHQVIFWSDSMNVLGWIRNNSRSFKTFVANRVGEIQSTTNPSQWRHVSSADNPADIISRGTSASQLISNQLWWSGPTFLVEAETEWPVEKVVSLDTACKDGDREKRNRNIALVAVGKSDMSWRLDPSRYSKWRKLTRVNAWTYRFLRNCSASKDVRMKGELSAEEIEDAEFRIIAQAQKEAFTIEYSALAAGKMLPSTSKVLPLPPAIDEHGLMRLSGRLVDAGRPVNRADNADAGCLRHIEA